MPIAPKSPGTPAVSSLVFREGERQDAAYTQFGEVAVPNQSGHIYLVTNRHGQHRLITVSAAENIRRNVRHYHHAGWRGRGSPADADRSTDRVLAGQDHPQVQPWAGFRLPDTNYAIYREHLRRTIDEPFALFLPG